MRASSVTPHMVVDAVATRGKVRTPTGEATRNPATDAPDDITGPHEDVLVDESSETLQPRADLPTLLLGSIAYIPCTGECVTR